MLFQIKKFNRFLDALTCALLRRRFQPSPLQHARAVLTIHDPAFAGIHELSEVPLAGLPTREAVPGGPFECDGKFSALRAGILLADSIHAVSPTYAQELAESEAEGGVWDALRERADSIHGVLGGVDLEAWDPQRDPSLASSFSAEDLEGREACRDDLLALSGLKAGRDTLLVGFAGRLLPEKGLDQIAAAMEHFRGQDIRIVGGFH